MPRRRPRTVEEAAEDVYAAYDEIKWMALGGLSAIAIGLIIGVIIT